jgi:Trypsin
MTGNRLFVRRATVGGRIFGIGRTSRRAWIAGALVGVLAAAGWAAAPVLGVAGGTPAPAAGYGFAAQISIGDTVQACSGVLVDPEWVVTAAACFATAGQPPVAGAPALPTTVTIGKTDLTAATGGQVRSVVEVVPHPDRGVLLAKLASPVIDISPVAIATSAPAAGELLQAAGYGRTATEWVPDRLHTVALSVQSVGDATIDLVGTPETPASMCKGDAGGPALRQRGSAVELVGVHIASTQGGCLGVADTQAATSTESRIDNVADWIRQTVRGANFVRLATSASVLDTRSGLGAPAGPRPAASTTTFPVAGVGGIPATGVTAVLVDMTAITKTASAYLTIFPEGTPRNPALSMVNAGADQTISNTAVVPVPASGKLSVFNSTAGLHVVVEVQGYYTRSSTTGGGLVPVVPTRVVDTRIGLGGASGAIPAGGNRAFTFTGGVVPAGAAAVLVDLIVAGAAGQGWIGTFGPGGTTHSIMDFMPGNTSHAVTAELGSDGKATFTNSNSTPVQLVMTAEGYYTASPATGAGLRTMAGVRKLDTRNVGTHAPVPANGTVDVPLGLPSGAAALVNLTVVNNTAGGALHAWPLGGTEPTTSLTNYPTANTNARSGLALVNVGTDGTIRIRNVGSGTVHILVDLQGWHAPN